MRYIRSNGGSHGCPSCCGSAEVRTGCAVSEQCSVLPVMAAILPQKWDCTYTCGQALARGTLFPALDKPFMGKGGCCNG